MKSNTKFYSKFKSRTFWFAVVWSMFVPLSVVIQAFTTIELPIDKIVGLSGAIVLAFIGGEKAINAFKASKAAKDNNSERS